MKVSVIIPAYNAAETIAETIESLLAQTLLSWEAIVVDDGSTDATGEIVRGFVQRDARFRMIAQSNAGESAARNAGISQARYDWLLFLDADDWISPIHLERMTKELLSDPELDAVHCGYARVASDGTLVVDTYQPPSGDMFPTLARRAAFPVHACIVRKSLVEDVGRFDTSLRTCPDWDLWQRIARTGVRFGAVREVLAFYRMRPGAASLDAYQLLKDDLRVLKQGHSADPRVKNPHPDHANGLPHELIQTQEFYLLSWCAGLLIGSGQDARPLLEMLKGESYPDLYPDAVAQCIFEAGILPLCQAQEAWEKLYPDIRQHVQNFLVALERHSMAPGLAERASQSLKKLILGHSPAWRSILDEYEGITEQQKASIVEAEQAKLVSERERDEWQRLAGERGEILEKKRVRVEELARAKQQIEKEREALQSQVEMRTAEREELQGQLQVRTDERDALQDQLNQRTAERDALQTQFELRTAERDELQKQFEAGAAKRDELQNQLGIRTAERDALLHSEEYRVGNYLLNLLNRLHLRRPLKLASWLWAAGRQRLTVWKLGAERTFLEGRRGRLRALTTVCTNFPIYSQTFVYQEIIQLARNGFDLRLVYSKLDPRDYLHPQFEQLWGIKRRLNIHWRIQKQDFEHYRARMPEKIESLISKLCDASGLTRQELISHGNFLQAFSFTKMVESYRPHYLHSYFFYDRSLMALVASFLLSIPRGISCYADHLLKDYELKLVPLHLQLCDLVIATSERVKKELLEIAPTTDANKILVKANAINGDRFPFVERREPQADEPFRIACICRIEPKKGLLYLVEAVHLLRREGLRVELHLVGAADKVQASQDYKRRLDQQITKLGLWGTVHLEGRQNEEGVLRFLHISHLFVAPFVETETGDKDGIPTAVLEAMATGIPTVATDAGSISEVIDDGLEGILVRQRDAVALAQAIEALLRDPDRRRDMGKTAAQKARHHFDVRVCEETFHERVRAIIEARSSTEPGLT
jgi:glycosyltransferase involved in cell wall biosynthesis